MNKKERKTVAVYSQDNQRQIAAKALEIAEAGNAEVSIVSVFPECDAEYAEVTENLYRYSSSIGAEMTVLYSTEPALALMEYVRHKKITDLIISESDTSGAAKLIGEIFPKVNITVVPTDNGSVCNLFAADLLCCALTRA
jgi:K+-sensing histidine kinase KdpD